MSAKVLPFPGHRWSHCRNPDCGGTCMDCNLAICEVCGLGEGALTTDCPRARIAQDLTDAIYAGKIDYRAGQWVLEASPHSPAAHRGQK